MEKHSHIVQLREREVTYFPVDSQAAPQQPVLQHQAEEEPWADRIWRIYFRPAVLQLVCIFGSFLILYLAIRGASYLLFGGGK